MVHMNGLWAALGDFSSAGELRHGPLSLFSHLGDGPCLHKRLRGMRKRLHKLPVIV